MTNLKKRLAHIGVSTYMTGALAHQRLYQVLGIARLEHAIMQALFLKLTPAAPFPSYEETKRHLDRMQEAFVQLAHACVDEDQERIERALAMAFADNCYTATSMALILAGAKKLEGLLAAIKSLLVQRQAEVEELRGVCQSVTESAAILVMANATQSN